MLAFIDESGHPHPKDSATKPVCVSVCINEKDIRFISGRLHALKRDILQREQMELKANRLINRGTFRNVPAKRELVESFFDLVRNLPLVIFAIVMERPERVVPEITNYLPNQLRYLLQRCDQLARDQNDMVTVLFDGDIQSCKDLPLKFSSFLYRSMEGQAMSQITDSPYFVDSRITAGIQIADMAAGVVRIFEENSLFNSTPVGNSFLSAIKRYHIMLKEKTQDVTSVEGYVRPGFYRMPETDHYILPDSS